MAFKKSDFDKRRKCASGKKKLPVGERVEIRSEEEGFLGSWHPGVVVRGGWRRRHVRYDHMLADDGNHNIVQVVGVPASFDGSCDGNGSRCYNRGRIRPIPPILELEKQNLTYGLCVDVNHEEAWWEGVIFDHNKNMEMRRIFFPDLGDELIVGIDKLRVSQDWDEYSENWHPRGTWLFLDLVEKCQKDIPLPVSIMQIWYDLREKEEFELWIKDWTCGTKSVWENLLEDVICENIKICAGELCNLESSAQETVPSNDVVHLETELGDSHASVPTGMNQENVDTMNLNCDSHQFDQGTSDKVQSMSISADAGSLRNSNGRKSNKFHPDGKSSKWVPAGPDLVPEPDSCPDAITKYAQTGRKSENKLVTEVKKHLKFLNWEFQYMKDQNQIRQRFISPGGKIYYSLRQACLDFPNSTMTTLPSNSDVQFLLPITENDMELPTPDQPEEHQDPDSCPQAADSPSPDIVFVEQEFNPQAAKDWLMFNQKLNNSSNMKRGETVSKARKHLSAMGWTFKINTKGKRFMYCCSPSGRNYYSIREACKAWLNGDNSEVNASTSGIREINFEIQDARNQLACREVPSSEHLVPPNGPFQNLSPESSSISMTRNVKRRRMNSNYLVKSKAAADNAILSRSKGKKDEGASKKLGGKVEGCHQRHVLRSRKRVKHFVPSSSKHNPLTVLSWLIDKGIILPRAKVFYRRRMGQYPKKEGRITREGIKCNCCGKLYTINNFEVHAVCTSGSRGMYIFLENGRSLLDCQLEVLNIAGKMRYVAEPDDRSKGNHHRGENDNICSVCHYGGELMLCDCCPSSFHKDCLGLKDVPDGNWFCPSCCCAICRGTILGEVDKNSQVCHQCERKFHMRCIQIGGEDKARYRSKGNWFCNKKCQKIFLGLQELLGKSVPISERDLTWRLVKSLQGDNVDLNPAEVEALSKLNIALSVMHECFEPNIELHSGRDLIEDVIFSRGSDLTRLNFRGFYTILLERNEELITVANLRVFGEKAAEVPLIGTRFPYRRNGMCRILMNELEKKLVELGVKRLMLPSIQSVLNTWTTTFGFSKMTDAERLQFVDCSFLDFPDTVMCQKILPQSSLPEPKLLRGAQSKLRNDICINGSYNEVERSTTLSEVSETGHIEDGGKLDQRLGKAAANGQNGNIWPRRLVLQLNLPACQESITTQNESQNGEQDSNSGMKCYKRKKSSASNASLCSD